MKNYSQSGFGLLEVVIAAGIISIFAGGVVLLSVASLRSSVINKHRTQAAALAQEAVEGIRVIRDSAWIDQTSTTDFQSSLPVGSGIISYNESTGLWIINSSVPAATSDCSAAGYEFSLNNVCFARILTIGDGPSQISNQNASGQIISSRKITVIVNWEDYGKPRNVQVETLLTNWRAY